MAPCKGSCTVRIFETRNLQVQSKPDFIDDATAKRELENLAERNTRPFKESGCEPDSCECVPQAKYMPDPKTGKRKVEPDWSQWTKRQLVSNVGAAGQPEFVHSTIEAHSAIVPGLCEKRAWVRVALSSPEGDFVTLDDGDFVPSDKAPDRAGKRGRRTGSQGELR